jgi:hypothetical protein
LREDPINKARGRISGSDVEEKRRRNGRRRRKRKSEVEGEREEECGEERKKAGLI